MASNNHQHTKEKDMTTTADRKMYELTKSDLRKISVHSEEDYREQLAAFDSEKPRLGKRFALRKRDHASSLLRCTREYMQGKGQGALDLANGLPYQADTNNSAEFTNAYNLGYYTGYESRSNLRDLIEYNPNFAHLKTEGGA